MRKFKLLIMLLLFFAVVGCYKYDQQPCLEKEDGEDTEVIKEDLNNSQIEEIKSDCLAYLIKKGNTNATIEDIVILEMYGSFNGVVIFRIQRGAYTAFTSIILGEYELTFPDTNTPLVWNNSKIYELKEAYDEKVLSDNVVKSLQTILNEKRFS